MIICISSHERAMEMKATPTTTMSAAAVAVTITKLAVGVMGILSNCPQLLSTALPTKNKMQQQQQ